MLNKKGKVVLGISIAMVCVAALIGVILLIRYLKRTKQTMQNVSDKEGGVAKHQNEGLLAKASPHEDLGDSSRVSSADSDSSISSVEHDSSRHHNVASNKNNGNVSNKKHKPVLGSSNPIFLNGAKQAHNPSNKRELPNEASFHKDLSEPSSISSVEHGSSNHSNVASNTDADNSTNKKRKLVSGSNSNPYLASIKKEKIDDFIESKLGKVEASVEKYVKVNNGESYEKFLDLLHDHYLDSAFWEKIQYEARRRFYLIGKNNLIDENLILATYLDMSAINVKYVILFGENCRDHLQSAQYKRTGKGGLAGSVHGANEIFLKYVDQNSLKPPRLMASFITMVDGVDLYLKGCLDKILASSVINNEAGLGFLNGDLSQVKIFSKKALFEIAQLYVEIASIQNSVSIKDKILEQPLKNQLFVILVNLCELRRVSDLLDDGLVLMSTVGKRESFDDIKPGSQEHRFSLPFGVGLGVAATQTQRAAYSTTFLQKSLASIVAGEKVEYFSWNEILSNDVFDEYVKNFAAHKKLDEKVREAILPNMKYFVSNAIQQFWQVSVYRCNDQDLMKMKNSGTCGYIDHKLEKTEKASMSANIDVDVTPQRIDGQHNLAK